MDYACAYIGDGKAIDSVGRVGGAMSLRNRFDRHGAMWVAAGPTS